MSFYIGKVKIDGRILLAPMAGVTNDSYRMMCHDYGASLVVSEMISDKGIFYHDDKTLEMLKMSKDSHPCSVQIFGGDIETLVYAAKFVDKNTDYDIIDINMGCPVPKVLKSHAGSDYLQDTDRIYRTVKAIVDSVDKPVSVKIRIGYDHDHINVLDSVDKIIKAGASVIVIHGRTKTDLYQNEVRYDLIKEAKDKHPDFPIIANGDILTPSQALEILNYTGCDAVMIGRATYGNFHIIKEMSDYVDKGILIEPLSFDERIEDLLKYAQNLIDLKGEFIAIKELRGQAPWFIKGIPNGAKFRNLLTTIDTYDDLINIIYQMRQNNVSEN